MDSTLNKLMINLQNATSKTEFLNGLKAIKNLGDQIFDEKEMAAANGIDVATTTTTTTVPEKMNKVRNPQLATPMTTPMDSNLLDDALLPISLAQNTIGNDNSVFLPIMNNSSTVLPSPQVFSPVQMNGMGCPTPFLQSTPFDKPEDIMATPLLATPLLATPIMTTPVINQIIPGPSIVCQDALDPFKSTATMASPFDTLLDQPQVASPFMMNDEVCAAANANDISEITAMTNSLISAVQNSPCQANDSLLLASPSDITSSVQNTPFGFQSLNTPLLSTDDLLTNNEKMNDTLLSADICPISTVTEKESTDLEKVDDILKGLTDMLTETTKDAQIAGNVSPLFDMEENVVPKRICDDNLGAFPEEVSFPSDETIKQCLVNEYKFAFTNENIGKLVRRSPIEVVQEDVIELEKLAKLKRGKGRPRKPRKYSLCPFINCHKKFNREFNLKEHIRTHDPNRSKSFKCKWCDECFYSSSVLSRHISSIHDGEKFHCKNCGKVFNRKDALHRHEKTSCQKLQNGY